MHISVVATDFDGTISEGDRLAPEAGRALHRLREAGYFTALVSGRSFDFLRDLQQREQAFDRIVAENGAVVYNPQTDELRLPFGEVPADLLDMLDRGGGPLGRGMPPPRHTHTVRRRRGGRQPRTGPARLHGNQSERGDVAAVGGQQKRGP